MGAVIKEPMMNIRINKVAAVIIGVVVLLALSAGATLLVTSHINAHNLAVQRVAASARHHRAEVAHAKAVQAAAIAAANAKAAKAESDARQAQRAARKAANRPVVVQQPAPVAVQPPSTGLTDCGTGIQGEEVFAGSDTSCPFALTVEADYWSAPGMEFTSYSSVTGQSYFMSAADSGDTVTVTNSTGALVEFSDGS
jgi:type II secretory pathway pseudopilin PulG